MLLSFLTILGIGYMLPREHQASREAVVRQPPMAVWNAITDHAAEPEWRPGVAAERQIQTGPANIWEEQYKSGEKLRFETVEFEQGRRLVRRVIDPQNNFGGTWTYELSPVADGTQITIREDGWVQNPMSRFMSRFVTGQTATLDRYLDDLQKKKY